MSAYRQTFGLAQRKRAELGAEEESIAPFLPSLQRAYARRWMRIAAGAVGVTMAFVWPFLNLLPRHYEGDVENLPGWYSRDEALSCWMLLSVAVTLATALVAYPLGRLRARRAMAARPLPAPTGHEAQDLSTLELFAPFAQRERSLQRLELPSVALPMVTVSAFAPLCLHLVAYGLMDGNGHASLRSYGEWISVSMLIVGHAHVALAICCVLFANKLKRMTTEEISAMGRHKDWAKAVGVATLVSAVPGIILIAVPPALSAVTALLFVPVMYWLARSVLFHERDIIDRARAGSSVSLDIADLERHVEQELGGANVRVVAGTPEPDLFEEAEAAQPSPAHLAASVR